MERSISGGIAAREGVAAVTAKEVAGRTQKGTAGAAQKGGGGGGFRVGEEMEGVGAREMSTNDGRLRYGQSISLSTCRKPCISCRMRFRLGAWSGSDP